MPDEALQIFAEARTGSRTWRLLAISLVGLAATLWAVGPALAQTSAAIHVQADSVRAVMPATGLGIHTSPYYNSMGRAEFDDRLEQVGVTTLRYGGGGYADVFHWSITRQGNGLVGSGLSPWQDGSFGYVGPGSDFGSFVRTLDQVDAGQAVITVNYGSAQKLVAGQSQRPDFGGQPQEAAAWVAYANADPAIYGTASDVPLGLDQQGNDWKTAGYWARLRASTPAQYQSWATADGVFNSLNSFLAIDRDATVGVKYWEIGNETFGTGYYGGGNGYSVDYDVPYDGTNRDDHLLLSPAQYGQEIVAYANLMKAVDPTIKIGAVLATPPDDYGWSYADLNDNGSKQSNEPYWNDQVLAQAAGSTDFVVVHWYPNAGNNSNGANLLSEVSAKLPRMINGTTAGLDVGSSAGLRDTLAVYGIPNAEIMVTEFNYFGSLQSGVADAAESIFVADAYATWLELGVTSVQYLEALTKDFLSDTSGLTPGSAFYGVSMVDRLAQPGDELVAATSSSSSLKVHAARQADGSVALLLLNLSLTTAVEAAITLDGAGVLLTEGERGVLAGGLNFSRQAVGGLGNQFLAAVPARTIVSYLLTPAGPGDFNGDGVVNGVDGLIWQQGLSPSPGSFADYEAWRNNYGGGAVTASANRAVPEPAACWQILLLGAGLRRPKRLGVGKSHHSIQRRAA